MFCKRTVCCRTGPSGASLSGVSFRHSETLTYIVLMEGLVKPKIESLLGGVGDAEKWR
ncbi:MULTISPECIES: hypothetical protein [Candidatus Ichthyocystis]|uniref:hypothetical protein n=1 Tax=Candidatus Ichthyocystis TaxID=2929841 RepID=UPI0015845445|nr:MULTISPECIES: hypothetical protein [Ichthyocystis]